MRITKALLLDYFRKKNGLCSTCPHAVFLVDGGVYCRIRGLWIYSKVSKCKFHPDYRG